MSTKTIVALSVIITTIILMLGFGGWLVYKTVRDQEADSSTPTTATNSSTGLSLGEPQANSSSNGFNLQGLDPNTLGTDSTAKNSSQNNSGSLPPPGSSEQLPKPVRTQSLPNGLKIDEYVFGTGERATKAGDTIAVHYIGYLTNGQVFDTSLKGEKKAFAFKVGGGQVIQGWDIGLQDMHIGGVRRLTIPATLAYGARGYPPSIPPNATLVFDVQLMGIQ